MTFDELVKHMPGIERASQMATAWWLAHQVRQLALDFTIAAPVCIEVGTWCGFTACAMADAGGRVICVDTFDGRDDQTKERTAAVHKEGHPPLERFLANGLALGSGRVLAVVGESPKVASLLPPGCAHLVFIDADHAEPAVSADLYAWGDRVKSGGVLCGHDWEQGGVQQAVRAYSETHGWPLVTAEPDQLWWMRRPPGT